MLVFEAGFGLTSLRPSVAEAVSSPKSTGDARDVIVTHREFTRARCVTLHQQPQEAVSQLRALLRNDRVVERGAGVGTGFQQR